MTRQLVAILMTLAGTTIAAVGIYLISPPATLVYAGLLLVAAAKATLEGTP